MVVVLVVVVMLVNHDCNCGDSGDDDIGGDGDIGGE